MPLTDEQALHLVSSSTKNGKAAKEKPEYTVQWPSRNEKLAILMAIKDDEETVLLRAGQFIIRRGSRTDPNLKIDDDDGIAYFVKPANDFMPCGWFSLKSLERELS